jgi:hypothetical protein
MSDLKERQSTDSKQGGEGTQSLDRKSYEPLYKDLGEVENTVGEVPALEQGTR